MKSLRFRPKFISHLLLTTLAFSAVACGHSEDEWQAQLAKYEKLADQKKNTEAELAAARARAEKLAQELDAMGFKLSEEGAEKDKLMDALQEYKQRAAALERIKARFESLRKKLEELTKLGLKIEIRKNRMVISLPGDVLFASGKDSLEDEGLDILGKVATVIREDKDLSKRTYQVAGHTDDQPISAAATKRQFKDNWGLSLMRAREVLLFLVSPMDDPKNPGGGLDSSLWSASGYGDTDPVVPNDSPENRQKNRRVELIMMPNVEEMLDLKSLVNEPAVEVPKAPAAPSTGAPASSETPAPPAAPAKKS